MSKRKREDLHPINEALDGLVIPDLQQEIIDFFELSPKRKEEFDKLIRGSSDELYNHIHTSKKNKHEMKCYLTNWIRQYSDKEYEVEDATDAVVISDILRTFGGLDNRGAREAAIRGVSLWLVHHLGIQNVSLSSALLLLLSPNTSTGFMPDFYVSCKHCPIDSHQRCSKCIAPLLWNLCGLYQVTSGTDWRRVFSDLVFYGFVDLAIEWVNRNLDTARIELPRCYRGFSLEAAKHPQINQLATLWLSLIQ